MKPLAYGISAILCAPSGKGKSALLRQILANYRTLLAPKLPTEIVMFVESIEHDAAPFIAAVQHGRVEYDSSEEEAEDSPYEDEENDIVQAPVAEDADVANEGNEGDEEQQIEQRDRDDVMRTHVPQPPEAKQRHHRHMTHENEMPTDAALPRRGGGGRRAIRRRRGTKKAAAATYLEALEATSFEPAPLHLTLDNPGKKSKTRFSVYSHTSLSEFDFDSIPTRSVVILDDLSVSLVKAVQHQLLKMVNYYVHHRKWLLFCTSQSVVASPFFGLLRNFSGVILQLGSFNNVALLQQLRIRYIQDGQEKMEFSALINRLLHLFGPDEFFWIFGNLPKKLVPYHQELKIFCRLQDPECAFGFGLGPPSHKQLDPSRTYIISPWPQNPSVVRLMYKMAHSGMRYSYAIVNVNALKLPPLEGDGSSTSQATADEKNGPGPPPPPSKEVLLDEIQKRLQALLVAKHGRNKRGAALDALNSIILTPSFRISRDGWTVRHSERAPKQSILALIRALIHRSSPFDKPDQIEEWRQLFRPFARKLAANPRVDLGFLRNKHLLD